MAIGTPTSLGTAVASGGHGDDPDVHDERDRAVELADHRPVFLGSGRFADGRDERRQPLMGADRHRDSGADERVRLLGLHVQYRHLQRAGRRGFGVGTVLTLTTSAGVDASIAVACRHGPGPDRLPQGRVERAGRAHRELGLRVGDEHGPRRAADRRVDGRRIGVRWRDVEHPGRLRDRADDVSERRDDWAFTTTYQIVAATASQNLAGTWAASANQVSAFVAYKGRLRLPRRSSARTFNAIPFMTGVL
jgi:hypothetical protein